MDESVTGSANFFGPRHRFAFLPLDCAALRRVRTFVMDAAAAVMPAAAATHDSSAFLTKKSRFAGRSASRRIRYGNQSGP